MKTKKWRVAAGIAALGMAVIAAATLGNKGNESSMKQIRTYMAYTTPVDPARIVTMPDMDLSYALGATLTEWSPTKQITGGLAASLNFPLVPSRFEARKSGRFSSAA
jgi:hypothetical protein